MLLKDIPTWFTSGQIYWYSQIDAATEDEEKRTELKDSFDVDYSTLTTAYNDYKSNSLEGQLISRLKVMVSYILLTTGTSTVPECPPVLNPGMPEDPDLRPLYEAWAITTAPNDASELFAISEVPEISTTSIYTDLLDILTNGNTVDSDRVMYLVNNMPAAIFDKLTYLKNNHPNIVTLTTGAEMEASIKAGTYLSDINAYFGWSIDHII